MPVACQAGGSQRQPATPLAPLVGRKLTRFFPMFSAQAIFTGFLSVPAVFDTPLLASLVPDTVGVGGNYWAKWPSSFFPSSPATLLSVMLPLLRPLFEHRTGFGGRQAARMGGHVKLDTCQRHGRIGWMTRPRHPDKHIEKAIQFAEQLGWRIEPSKGHAWGRLFCPHSNRNGCIVAVYSTPRDCENHARHIQREIDNCPHSRTSTFDPQQGQQ